MDNDYGNGLYYCNRLNHCEYKPSQSMSMGFAQYHIQQVDNYRRPIQVVRQFRNPRYPQQGLFTGWNHYLTIDQAVHAYRAGQNCYVGYVHKQ